MSVTILIWHVIQDQNLRTEKKKKSSSFDNPGKKGFLACILSAPPKGGLLPVF